MRKLKLLFAAAALVVGGVSTVNAQTPNPGDDMTSYITNPTFTDNDGGWTITGDARYYNGKGFDGTTNFIELTNWNSSWDATISQTINSLPNGYYKVQAAGQMSNASDLWMKLVANGAESRFSRNNAENGNILADGTETTIGSGVAGWRYTRVIAKVTDGTLAISCVGHSDSNERWANFDAVTLTYLGSEIAPNTDVTEFISNWDFWGCFNDEFNGWEISKTGGNSWVHGNTAVEHWSNDLSRNFDYYQTITGLPEGRYILSASMWNTQGSGPNGHSGVYATNSSSVTDFAGVTDDCGDTDLHTYTTNGIFVNDGELRVGVKNDETRSAFWFGVDWIKMTYVGKVVQDYAVELPDGGAMVADTWYYFDIAAAADNYNATATTLGDIICVTDGNTLTSAATGTVTLSATDNNLSATRYYVKSSSNNNLVVAAASYTYSISKATADVAYIQKDNTVTVSYTVSTNDPAGNLTQNYNGVTFGGETVTCIPTASGFTFTVPTVTANTDYTLSIPAGAIKYNNENQNVAQDIKLMTPAIFDGTYFLKVANETAAKGKYLARGYNYGTHATIDKYGLPITINTDNEGKSTLSPADTKRYYFHTNSWDCYADQASINDNAKFIISVTEGKYRIHNSAMAEGTYLKYNDSAVNDAMIPVFDDGTGSNNGPIIDWILETAAEHATAMQALKDNQAATAAAAAYASGNYASLNGITTVSALEAELTANYIQGDFVSASSIESISEIYQNDGNGAQPGNGNSDAKVVYSNSINITEPGFYKFSMQAFYRCASNEVTQAMHTADVDFPPVVLFFGDSETQIKSIYDEGGLDQGIEDGYFETETIGGAPVQYNNKWYTNGQHNSVIIFQKDYYHNDVWFYCSTPGTYNYGVKYQGYANTVQQWFIYSPESVTITSYAAAADASDYTALNAAITAYDDPDVEWGFEAGEYAPYNNANAIINYPTAKALDQEVTNSKLLVNSLTTALALTANTEEVNAFCDGDFSECDEDNSVPLDYTPAGWTPSGNFRSMLKNEETYPGLAVASATSAVMSWSGGITYGEQTGYEMPLKANTVYTLKLKAAGWNNETRSGISVSILNGDDGMALYNLGTPDRDIKGNEDNTAGMTSYEYVFATGAAGNYVFHIQSGNNMVITDFEIKKAASQVLEFADGSVPTYAPGTYPSVKISRTLTAGRWATAVYPFSVPTAAVDDIAVLDSYDDETGKLGFATNASTANEPFLMRSTNGTTEINLTDVEVAAAAATDVVKNEASLKGVYTTTTVGTEDGVTNYVLSNNVIYPIGDKAATVNPYRAYIQIDDANPARLTFTVDGEATAIEGIFAEKSIDGNVYNLKGQKMNGQLKKGIYVVNGKKTVVK